MAEEVNQDEVMEKLNSTLDDLIKYKDILSKTILNLNDRMDVVDKKLGDGSPNMVKKIDALEIAIEEITSEQGKVTKLTRELDGLLEGHEKILSQLEKEHKENLQTIKSLDIHVHSVQENLEEKVKENGKEFSKLKKDVEKSSKFAEAFKNFIKAVVES